MEEYKYPTNEEHLENSLRHLRSGGDISYFGIIREVGYHGMFLLEENGYIKILYPKETPHTGKIIVVDERS